MNNVRIWLGPARVEKDFDVARELHCSGTNAWFLNHKSFRNWCNGHYPYLWIHGVSGCGKTVLSSQVIKELDEDCLYFFFDFRDIRKQTLNDVLRTLIHQLLLKRPETKSALRPFYSHFVHKMPSTGDLKRAFDDMMTAADSIPIIFDALDEAKLTEVDALLRWIIEMCSCQGAGKTRVLMTSRSDQPNIRAMLQPEVVPRYIIRIGGHLIQKDIHKLVCTKLEKAPGFDNWRDRKTSMCVRTSKNSLLRNPVTCEAISSSPHHL